MKQFETTVKPDSFQAHDGLMVMSITVKAVEIVTDAEVQARGYDRDFTIATAMGEGKTLAEARSAMLADTEAVNQLLETARAYGKEAAVLVALTA